VQNSVNIGKPIIGVSINYRLSAWGFLSGSQEIKDAGNMNLGLRDQRLALQWIQENIDAFGGDHNQVTIFGESAGAASVGFQLTAYSGRDDKLFRGAVMQSGNPINYGPLNDPLGYSKASLLRTKCMLSLLLTSYLLLCRCTTSLLVGQTAQTRPVRWNVSVHCLPHSSTLRSTPRAPR
jgi:hypothetical protein